MNDFEQLTTQQQTQLTAAVGTPAAAAQARSRQRVAHWLAGVAPLLQWAVYDSPVGRLYLAQSAQGLCRLDLQTGQATFLGKLDPLARTEHNPAALAPVLAQLRDYFAGARTRFDFALDMARLSPFQRSVLQMAQRIPRGTVWTYAQLAQAIGKPRASRAVGGALGNNPIPIVVPCHRVIASSGRLQGYAFGLDVKRQLLQHEGALPA